MLKQATPLFAGIALVPAVVGMLVTLTASAAVTEDVAITPQLRAGDSFRLELVRTHEDSSRPQQSSRFRTGVEVRVISVSPEGIALKWAVGEPQIKGQPAPTPLVNGGVKPIYDVEMRVVLDAAGVFKEFEKYEESFNNIQKADSRKQPEGPAEAFLDQLLLLQELAATQLQHAEIYFRLNGTVVSEGNKTRVRFRTLSPLDRVVRAMVGVDIVSTTAESVLFRTVTTYDSPLQINEEGQYVFDRSVGLMREVSVNRRLTDGDKVILDSWQIKMVTSPKRP